MTRLLTLFAVLAAAGALIAGCGSDNGSSSTSTSERPSRLEKRCSTRFAARPGWKTYCGLLATRGGRTDTKLSFRSAAR